HVPVTYSWLLTTNALHGKLLNGVKQLSATLSWLVVVSASRWKSSTKPWQKANWIRLTSSSKVTQPVLSKHWKTHSCKLMWVAKTRYSCALSTVVLCHYPERRQLGHRRRCDHY